MKDIIDLFGNYKSVIKDLFTDYKENINTSIQECTDYERLEKYTIFGKLILYPCKLLFHFVAHLWILFLIPLNILAMTLVFILLLIAYLMKWGFTSVFSKVFGNVFCSAVGGKCRTFIKGIFIKGGR